MDRTWSLEDLYRTILRRWRTLVLVASLFVLASLATNFLFPQRYESNAVLTVEPIAAIQTDGAPTQVNMETERVIATSSEVLAMASQEVPGSTVMSLQEAVEVSVPRDSQVLDFRFTASTPERSAAGANAIAEAYNAQRVANARRVVSEATDNIEDRVNEQTSRLDGLPPESSERRNLELQIEALQGRLATLSSATFSSGSIVSPAVAPADSTKPSIAVFLAAGVFLGVMVGAFVALIRGRSFESKSAAAGASRSSSLKAWQESAEDSLPSALDATEGRATESSAGDPGRPDPDDLSRTSATTASPARSERSEPRGRKLRVPKTRPVPARPTSAVTSSGDG